MHTFHEIRGGIIVHVYIFLYRFRTTISNTKRLPGLILLPLVSAALSSASEFLKIKISDSFYKVRKRNAQMQLK